MKAKRPGPVRDADRRRGKRQPGVARGSAEAPPRKRRPSREPQRPLRSAPQTGPIPRQKTEPARPKTASQAKARAKARKAKAPKVVRPPLRERILLRLSSIELNPRELVARVPFVVLVIAALGLGLGITLWLSTSAAERSYQLGHARQVNQGLLQQKEALERDVLEAQAAPALAEAARNLGMIPSRDTAHLVQDPTGNWVVVGTPKPAEGVPPPPLNAPLPPDAPPPPPAPPAPRVVEPREVPIRVPEAPGLQGLPGIQAAPGIPGAVQGVPGAVPGETPHVAPGAQPQAPGPVIGPLTGPAPMAVPMPVPAEVPLATPQAPQQAAPLVNTPAPQQVPAPAPLPGAVPQGAPLGALPGAQPAVPDPATAVEHFSPAVAPVA
ncbi:hypothetical protein [Mycolicibacterium smegmatis]|uniref:FHA domain containing protein n=2 Tax=Mycolicibacterium smegmatis (strain ATCC 700084 / mc(2)155) TaxID=246196 RepID=I7GBN3_MYCS2|nr:hypothetical protein [Mycolicibacterium smegmatis]ABK72118.1 conserved hypothetical protein [Mycolicibacterium smegmatis MC2 155]AFP40591.1 FHA domain containing protein [Mycolicibacterium smegmatis MC2 155]AIU09327.1 membrane protein [Mycolicibacterium smegmatis MC2 155]AIU15952.1 membrane protein [Mycolicibacterium smegmatis]AIU22575.1 membrane protein [Mycolicibacterium smegmatis]